MQVSCLPLRAGHGRLIATPPKSKYQPVDPPLQIEIFPSRN